MALSDAAGGLRGGVAFLTRLPVRASERDWRRFQTFPPAFPAVGYLVGAPAAVPLVVLSGPTAALGYLVALVALTGIVHLDGVADLGDATAVHDADGRLDVLTDTTTGVGGVVAVTLVVAGLALAGVTLAGLPARATVAIVVAAEVGAKLGMATAACVGSATHEGLASGFTASSGPLQLLGPVVVATPAAALAWGSPAGVVAVLAGPTVGVALVAWSARSLGGLNGDVLGAVNECGRVVGLHAGVVAWTHF